MKAKPAKLAASSVPWSRLLRLATIFLAIVLQTSLSGFLTAPTECFGKNAVSKCRLWKKLMMTRQFWVQKIWLHCKLAHLKKLTHL